MNGRIPGRLPAILVLAHMAVRAADTAIPVPNASFELPVTGYVDTRIDSWQETPRPADYVDDALFRWDQLTGVFRNNPAGTADHIVNCLGGQAMYLFAVPAVGIFQDHDSRDWDDAEPSRAFDAVFEPGRSYTLTAGVIGMGGNMLEGVPLEMALYAGAATGSPRTVAALTITNGPAVFPNRTNLVDHTLRTPMVRAGDAWAGQHIGIRFLSTVTDDMKGGYWVLDNVRLSSTPGPASPGPLRIRLESPGPRIEWDGFAGRTYRLFVSTDLAAWLPVGDPIAGVDGTMSRTVPFDGGVARFFRLEIPTVP